MFGVSIIVPLYNKERTIADTVESILEQSDPRFEVIVVDDGSQDASVAKLAGQADRINLIQQANAGPSAARNRGAVEAKYDVLAFADADDRLDRHFVARHLKIREHHPDVQLSINSFEVIRDGTVGRTEHVQKRIADDLHDDVVLDVVRAECISNVHSSGFCIDRSVFDASGGYTEDLRCWEITEALLRFALHSERMALLADVLSQKFEEDDENSQFERFRSNVDQYMLYCQCLMRSMPELCEASRSRFGRELQSCCSRLLRQRKFRQFVGFMNTVQADPAISTSVQLSWRTQLAYRMLRLI